jgi:hypothetical protein
MKSLLIYLLLVGGPLAGLFGILHAGSRLEAPPSIGGAWRMEAPPFAAGPEEGETTIEISQSGEHVELRIDGALFDGKVRGDSIVAATKARAERRGEPVDLCGPLRGITMRARLDRAAEPDRMTAVFSLPASTGCTPSTVQAVRMPALKREGGH